jgi:26S proteasome regulatory subunit N2
VLEPYLPKEAGAGGAEYELGGGLYALGLIYASHGASVVPYLQEQLSTAQSETVKHGGALGLGLAAMGIASSSVTDTLRMALFEDSAVAGEATGLALGLNLLGTGDAEALSFMIQYAQDTEHEKIIRGLALGIALVLYERQEQADGTIEQLMADKDPILRKSACHAMAMAYAGTNDNRIIKRCLHIAVSDANDDVRRAAATAIGFLLLRNPDQLPSVVSLLCESFNPHVRVGCCYALGVACAATGSKEALALVEPMTKDTVPFVRQGAWVASALILLQQPNSNGKAMALRKRLPTVVADKHEATLSKFGAILAQGILEAGGRNVSIRACREHGHMDAATVAGLFVFTQVRSWGWKFGFRRLFFFFK